MEVMDFNNKKFLIILVCAVIVVAVPFFFHLKQGISLNDNESLILPVEHLEDQQKSVQSIDQQNTLLTDYFASLYQSQKSSIENRYNQGSISQQEMDKELVAVQNNNAVTINTLNKLTEVKKQFVTGNITKEDFIIQLTSLEDINSDLKTEIQAALNGY